MLDIVIKVVPLPHPGRFSARIVVSDKVLVESVLPAKVPADGRRRGKPPWRRMDGSSSTPGSAAG
jgi:hypothetical protein